MSQYINQAQVITADEVEPTKNLVKDNQKMEQTEITIDIKDDQYIYYTMNLVKDDQKMDQTEITIDNKDDQDVYYMDADGGKHCYWCYVLLRNLELYQRPWDYCRTCNSDEQVMGEGEWSTISEQEAGNVYDIVKNIKPEQLHLLEPIRDGEGNAYCPRCHTQLNI
ncbi:unnamed protein product [Meganyctiphanes norvegica]|uniref:Uncharacterized protein n=1 Tax=Meganyctiphanes norvegica TaxID=48144 RepID=A0AAV2REH9_MEGNR